MTTDTSAKPVNGPPQPGPQPSSVAQPSYPMHQQLPGQPPQFQPEKQHQMQGAPPPQQQPQVTSASSVVSTSAHPQMSAFMGYPQQAPQPQPPGSLPPGSLPPGSLPPGSLPPGSLPPGTSANSAPPVQAFAAPPRLPGAIQNHNNPYAAIGAAGQRGPTPNFGRYPQAPAYQ